jgi:AraC-like DNA-binding protein
MADFLAEKLQEIDNRLKELRPLHEEFLKLERAKQALEGMDAPRRRGPGRPRGSGAATGTRPASSNGRRRRRRGRSGGTAADKVLDVVRQNPGITVSEVGDRLGYTQKNYLYRVFHNLTEDGSVKKQGKGYSAA